jgi:hypothetical protein
MNTRRIQHPEACLPSGCKAPTWFDCAEVSSSCLKSKNGGTFYTVVSTRWKIFGFTQAYDVTSNIVIFLVSEKAL